jgi:hypothetical protein
MDDTSLNTSPVDELTMLKERADTLGVDYGAKIGLDTLKQRVNDKINGVVPETEEKQAPDTKAPVVTTRAQKEQKLRDDLAKKHLALVRVKIYNLDPKKNDLRGEIITVGNRFIGTVRKFIPFGEATDNGYHIPKILYEELKQRRFQQIRTKTVNGQIEVKTRMVPEYSLEVMPQLTDEERNELAIRQAAAERVGAD